MDYNKITQETYDIISKDWEEKRKYSWKPVEEFLENITDKKNKKLLDLGCGGGRHLEIAEQFGFEKQNLLGCDYSNGQLKTVKEKGFDTQQANLTNLPFEDNSFDTIVCIAAHHHLLEKGEQLQSLKEIKRVLNKEGKILLSNWFPSQEYIDEQIKKKKFEFISSQKVKVTFTSNNNKYNRYYYLFEEKELIELCKQANLNIEKKEYNNGNLYLTLK